MSEISSITLPSGTTYTLKDSVARQAIAGSGLLAFIGKPSKLYSDDAGTTEVADFGDDNETVVSVKLSGAITIRGTSYLANAIYVVQTGDTMVVGDSEYVVTVAGGGSGEPKTVHWNEFGSTSSLGALAFKDSGSVTITPSGSVSVSVSDVAATSADVADTASGETPTYTPEGTVSAPTFTGSSMTSTGVFTPEGDVNLTTTNKTATVSTAEISSGSPKTYTPAGSVSTPTISVDSAGATTSINNPTAATVATAVIAAAPTAAAPSNEVTYYSVSGETLVLYKMGYSTGPSITTSSVTVKTGDASYKSSTPTFTGTDVRLVTGTIAVPTSAAFVGTEGSLSVSGTTAGSVSAPTFTGKGVDITVDVPNAFSGSFSGTEQTASVSFS